MSRTGQKGKRCQQIIFSSNRRVTCLDKEVICRDYTARFSPMDSSRRTYLFLLILVALWCGLLITAPLTAPSSSLSDFSRTTYAFFARICHQLDDRSFHLDGHKLAVCIRCSSIYVGFFLSLLLYPLVRDLKLRSTPSNWILGLSLLPLFMDIGMNLLGVHTSTMETRVVSGGLFGVVLPWYILPTLQQALDEFGSRWRNQKKEETVTLFASSQ